MAWDWEQFYEQLQKESNPQLQALWKEIQELVDDAKTNDDKFDFNDILNSSFEFEIGKDTATKIIEDINNLMKENPKYNNNEDLMMVITYLQPFANPIDNYTMPQEDPAIGTEGNVDINRDLKKQIKEISNRITNILTKTPEDQTELIYTLCSLQNILKDRNDINPREMDQIKRLINADNSFTDEDVFRELSTFIKKIEWQVNNLKDYNDLMNKYEQSQKKFNEFCDTINRGQFSLLDKFNNNEDLNKISFFIEHNPWNENILNLYLAMMNIKDSQWWRLSGNDIHWWDRWAFNNVLRILDNQYWEGKIYHEKVQLHFLDIKFEERLQGKTLIEFCKETLKINWDWKNINEGSETISNFCKSRGWKFTEKQFVDKFNEKNYERRSKNKETIINKIDIIQKLWENIMGQIELNPDSNKLEFKEDENNCVDFNAAKLQELIKETPGDFISTSDILDWVFIDNQEIFQMIMLDNDIAKARIQKIIEHKQHEAENPAANPEIEQINPLQESDISNDIRVFKIEKNDIVSTINDAISKINDHEDIEQKKLYIERIKEVINALKNPWEKVHNTWSTSIQGLQNAMNKTLEKHLKPDWKLWNKTLYVIKEYIWVLTKKEQLLHDRGELSFSAKQLEILSLINTKGKENDLKWLLSIPDDIEDINEFALNLLEKGKRREYLEAYISNKNFPWKGEISEIINNKWPRTNLKKLQLQLIPYYEWHTDWLMGPLTLTAIETYVQNNDKWENNWENSNKIEIPEKDNANIVRLNNNNEAVTNNSDEINTVINKTKKHAYFLDWADFKYEKDASNSSTMKITVKNTRDDKEETYTYNSTGSWSISKDNDVNWSCDDNNAKHLQFLKNAKTIFEKISQ